MIRGRDRKIKIVPSKEGQLEFMGHGPIIILPSVPSVRLEEILQISVCSLYSAELILMPVSIVLLCFPVDNGLVLIFPTVTRIVGSISWLCNISYSALSVLP